MSKRIAFLKENFVPKIEKSPFFKEALLHTSIVDERFKGNVQEPTSEDVFVLFVKSDPTPNSQYLEWMLLRFLDETEGAERLMVEDLEKAREDLEFLFKHHAKLPKDKRNIKDYKSLQELYASLSEIRKDDGFISESQSAKVAKEGIEVWLDNDEWYVVMPTTQEAAIIYGKGTRWCTATQRSSNFDYYNRQGPLIIIINKKDEDKKTYKHQFHWESNQFMDATDSRIDEMAFLKKNPDVLHAIIGNIKDTQAFTMRLLFNLPIEEEHKKISGDLDLTKIQIEDLTPGLVIDGSLKLEGAQNIKRIHNLKVTGDLDLTGSSVESITGTLEVGKVLKGGYCSNLKEIPDNIKIGGSCKLIGCNLSKLPSNSHIGGNLYVSNNQRIKEIPEDLFVKTHFYGRNTGIKEAPKTHKIQRRVFLGDE